jgi:hypothetical protein
LEDQPSRQNHQTVMRELLRYLIAHPDAKDTLEGIVKWWLSTNQGEWSRAVVQAALDLLVKRGWLTVRGIIPARKIYGVNPARLDEIRAFLREPEPD